nr:MAG TPA: hypothetical protein [Caudoviricetes sp.]
MFGVLCFCGVVLYNYQPRDIERMWLRCGVLLLRLMILRCSSSRLSMCR